METCYANLGLKKCKNIYGACRNEEVTLLQIKVRELNFSILNAYSHYVYLLLNFKKKVTVVGLEKIEHFCKL